MKAIKLLYNTKCLKTILVCFALCASITTHSWAQKILYDILETEKLKVGVSGTQPPYSMEAIDGTLIGFDVDLALLIADAMDVELELVQIPFSDLLASLSIGKVDMVLSGLGMTTERNMQFAFVGPYHMSGISVLSKSAEFTNRNTVSSMNSKKNKIATLKNSTSEVFVKSQFPEVKIMAVANYDEAIEMLRKDEIVAMIADFSECTFASFKHPEDRLLVMRDLLTTERVGIALSPEDPLLVNLISNLFNEFQETGVFTNLENTWFVDSSWIDRVN
jgi:polar amino acid transport system substrate-binding protein